MPQENILKWNDKVVQDLNYLSRYYLTWVTRIVFSRGTLIKTCNNASTTRRNCIIICTTIYIKRNRCNWVWMQSLKHRFYNISKLMTKCMTCLLKDRNPFSYEASGSVWIDVRLVRWNNEVYAFLYTWVYNTTTQYNDYLRHICIAKRKKKEADSVTTK